MMKKEEDILIGKRIKDIRVKLKMGQKPFSEKINSSVPAVSNWENGRNKPNAIMIQAISDLGGISVNELLYGGSQARTRDDERRKMIGERIKKIRVNRKETLEDFAAAIQEGTDFKIKTTKSNVSKWESGLNVPNDISLKAIANLGGISVSKLLYGKDPHDCAKGEKDMKKLSLCIETKTGCREITVMAEMDEFYNTVRDQVRHDNLLQVQGIYVSIIMPVSEILGVSISEFGEG